MHRFVFNDELKRTWLSSCELYVVESLDDLQGLVTELMAAPVVCFDTETTGLRVIDDEVVALQFSPDGVRSYFVAINMLDVRFVNLPMRDVVRILEPVWRKGFVGHNLGFDWKMMVQHGADFHIVADTLLQSKLYDVYDSAALKDLALKHLQLDEVITFKSLFPPRVKKEQRRFDVVDYDRAVPYALQDVLAGFRLYEWFKPHMNPDHFIYQLEHACIKPLARMELLGVRLDLPQIEAAKQEAERTMADAQAEIDQLAGRPVTLSKPRDVAQLLFTELKLPVIKSSEKTGAPSTDAASLKALEGKHPVVDAILRYREAEKIKVSFLDPLPEFVQKDGCIHTQYNQYGADSGRLSSKEPNLQQVPKERDKSNDALRRAVRGSFLPPPGFVGFLDSDYSQVEYRLFASLAGEQGLLDAFAKDIDVHIQTASIMLHKTLDEVKANKNLRQQGKSLNFMAIYGGSKYKLSEMVGCSVDEAEQLLDDYWCTLPSARRYVEGVKARARALGYCETYFGRRRALPGINSSDRGERSRAERQAVNTSIQGTAADLIKMAIVRADTSFQEKGFKSRLVLNVHDQLVVAHHPDDQLDDVAETLRWAMEISMPGWCEIRSDPGYGPHWNAIEDYTYPSRRQADGESPPAVAASAPSPVPTSSIMTEAPPISGTESLTIDVSPTTPRELLQRLASTFHDRPGTSTLFIRVGKRQIRAFQGVQVDRPLLLQLRAEAVRYEVSPDLEKRLMRG